MTIITLGIDLGKTLCSLAGLDEEGRVVLRKRRSRATAGGSGSALFRLTGKTCGVISCLAWQPEGSGNRPAGHPANLRAPYRRAKQPHTGQPGFGGGIQGSVLGRRAGDRRDERDEGHQAQQEQWPRALPQRRRTGAGVAGAREARVPADDGFVTLYLS